MRVLHVDSGRGMRGGQWQVLYLLRGLRDRGHDVTLLARGELLHAATTEAFDCRPVTAWEIMRRSRESQVVHVHDAHTHAVAAVCGSGRLVVSRRVAFPLKRSAASRWKYSRGSHYIAVSHFVAGVLTDAGLKPEDISVVYDGVPLLALTPAMSFCAVAPSSDDPMKGSELAREAAALAGVELRFSSRVVDDLRAAGVLLYVTRSEGLGSAALLAMAAGRPVIASRLGGLIEVVDDGVTGFLVENRAADLAAALRKLADHPSMAAGMGAAGRHRVESLFSLDAMVEGTLRCYEKALN